MRNQIIAKRYAKALFSLAVDGGWIGQYGRDLDEFVRLLKDYPELADAIQNPLYPQETKKAVFAAIVDKAGMSPVVRSFIDLLIEKKRVQYVGEIAEVYHQLIDEHSNIARAKLSAPKDLDESMVQEIARTLENMTGKKIVIEFRKDPTLIGGVVARIGDLVLDGSVKRQLLMFKETLKRGALG